MRLNYNFAFKDSKLTPWERPSPSNLLISDASLDKKLSYIPKSMKIHELVSTSIDSSIYSLSTILSSCV